MNDLDFGPHRTCNICKKSFPQKRMLEYNDKWYCGISHKLKQEEIDDDTLYRRVTGNTVPYREH